jgi:pimeloyl-ACP methyl ester carboxylesterase
MWSALTLTLLTGGIAALYADWAIAMAARGVSPWLLLIGAPLLYGAIVFVITLVYFAAAWLYRAKRPPQAQIGLGATLRLIGNEYRALLGSAGRMIFYRWLIREPPPAKTRAPVLLVHGVLCNAGVWSRFSRLLRARGVRPVYTISYGPPLASIDLFADQLAVKIDRILAETGAPSVVTVTHSMGGLVVLAYCRKYGADKIRRLIALAAPFHGSIHAACFPGVCLTELRPGSLWLKKLYRREFARPPISSIWSWHDSMVAPQTSCKLENAQNIALTGVGHNAILADPGAFARAAALIAAEQARAEKAIDDAPEPSLTSESPASVAQTPSARA